MNTLPRNAAGFCDRAHMPGVTRRSSPGDSTSSLHPTQRSVFDYALGCHDTPFGLSDASPLRAARKRRTPHRPSVPRHSPRYGLNPVLCFRTPSVSPSEIHLESLSPITEARPHNRLSLAADSRSAWTDNCWDNGFIRTIMLDFLGDLKRTHMCGELRASDAGSKVVLMGWVNKRRDLGNLIFLDLRDRSGITQAVITSDAGAEVHERATAVRSEFVVAVIGHVKLREANTINKNIPTGEIEVVADELRILNDCKPLPFTPADAVLANEEVRLKYRYVDLRRPEMQYNIQLRHRVSIAIREYLNSQGFYEIETPFMTRSTPEGARDYLVPSRVYPGRVLRAAAIAAALQADPDDLRLRPLLPDRALLPRRRPARRPPAGVHPDRSGDQLRASGDGLPRGRGIPEGGVLDHRRGPGDAVPADDATTRRSASTASTSRTCACRRWPKCARRLRPRIWRRCTSTPSCRWSPSSFPRSASSRARSATRSRRCSATAKRPRSSKTSSGWRSRSPRRSRRFASWRSRTPKT